MGVQAQIRATPAAKPTVEDPATPDANSPTIASLRPEQRAITKLFGRALYSEVIDETTAALEKEDKDKSFWLYWRGSARKRMSQFDGAREDLEGLGNYVGWPKFPPAADLVKQLDTQLELRPPNKYEIRDGDNVIFRVYYGDDQELFRSVVQALPKGYNAASRFTNAQTSEVPVFLFDADKYDQFYEFYSLLKGSPPRFWWQVLSHSGAITISRADSNGKILKLDRMVAYMSHEMTHQFLQRRLGSIKDLPNWFNEGAARSGESLSAPELTAQNDRRIQQLLAQNAILPLKQLVSNADFHDAVDEMKAGEQKGDAYAQGFNMTRYLGILLEGEKMGAFLDTIRDKSSFAEALKEGTDMTPDEFFDSWLDAVSGDNR